jgi:hypothetical protein
MSANQAAQVPDFSYYIADRTKNFTGRDWVFAKMNGLLWADDTYALPPT